MLFGLTFTFLLEFYVINTKHCLCFLTYKQHFDLLASFSKSMLKTSLSVMKVLNNLQDSGCYGGPDEEHQILPAGQTQLQEARKAKYEKKMSC